MSSKHELLRECSSFYNNNESDPWEMHFPVISSINGDTFSTILNIVKNCVLNPSQNAGILIHGEAGFGKTHMIGRVRKHCESSDIPAFFSSIRPIIDEKSPIRHLMRGIITSLAHDIEGTSGYSQIHKLISEIIIDYYQSIITEETGKKQRLEKIQSQRNFFFKPYRDQQSRADIVRNNVISWLTAKNCNINPHFIKLLFSFCNPNKQAIAFQRLIGNIADEEDAKILEVPFTDNISDSSLEDEAREFLISLGLILASYGHVLVVCFDQLENLHKKEQITAFGLMILTLVNECKAMLPLAMLRILYWDEVIRPNLERSVIERLTSNNFTLYGCKKMEIEEILKTRVKACLNERWEEPYSWLLSQVMGTITPNPSPREVISLANHIIHRRIPNTDSKSVQEISYPTPDEVIQTAYQNERDQILSDLDSWPADYEELSEAIILNLTSKNFTVIREQVGHKAILKINKKEHNCCLIINTNPNHSAIGSSFGYGTEYLLNNPGASCLYITDPRCLITKPTWKVANIKKEQYLQSGGRIYQPSEGNIAHFYALYSIYCKITEGDLLIECDAGMRSVSKEELILFIGQNDLFSLPLSTPQTVANNEKLTNQYPEDAIHSAICTILKSASMHVMKSTHVAERLNSLNIQITHDELLIWCGEHKESYIIFRSPQGSTIMLKRIPEIC